VKSLAVGELKSHFSQILDEVKQGAKVGILYGKNKKPVAMIVPYVEEKSEKRRLGILDGKVKIEFMDDFEMTDEELIGL
jgi:antitoxin (DNA-binding transcriptional repressor) of toxin-antitoxin stability system